MHSSERVSQKSCVRNTTLSSALCVGMPVPRVITLSPLTGYALGSMSMIFFNQNLINATKFDD